jgi:hypothetical protein
LRQGGGTIERRTACQNGALHRSRNEGPVGIWAHNVTNIKIQDCKSYRNRTGSAADGVAFDFGRGVSNSVMQYNLRYDYDGSGCIAWNDAFTSHPVERNVIRHNISAGEERRHSHGFIQVGTAGEPLRDIQIYGNTIVMKPTADGLPKPIWVGGARNAGVRFRGNLLTLRGAGPLIAIEGGQEAVAFDANTYRSEVGHFLVIYHGKSYHSPANWSAETGRELIKGCAPVAVSILRLATLDLWLDAHAPRNPASCPPAGRARK